MRASVRVVAMLLLSAPLLGQLSDPIPLRSWPAPPYYFGGDSQESDDRADAKISQRRGPIHLMTDLTAPLPFVGIVPCRLADTRAGSGFPGQYGPPSLTNLNPRTFTIAGQCGIPANAGAVSFNFAVTSLTSNGNLVVYPAGATPPTVSSLNWTPSEGAISNAAVVALGAGGAITVFENGAAGSSVDLIIDVNGYYVPSPVVKTLNGLFNDVSLVAGSNISITPSGQSLTIAATGSAAGWSLVGNSGTVAGPNFLGTTDNQALEIRVGNSRALRIEPTFGGVDPPNIIGGSPSNSVTTGAFAATIAGGGFSGLPNKVTETGGTIGGGFGNQAGNANAVAGDALGATVGGGSANIAYAQYTFVGGGNTNSATGDSATIAGGMSGAAAGAFAFIGGGQFNAATGASSMVGGGSHNAASADFATVAGGGDPDGANSNYATERWATVGGGRHNLAGNFNADPTDAEAATVAGGQSNAAGGHWATVGGGAFNSASGVTATIPGGANNLAIADGTFAAGSHADANQPGAFVWSDTSNFTAFASTAANEFSARAAGGFRFVTSTDGSGNPQSGCNLPGGSGTFSCTSDRYVKDVLADVDPRDVLRRVVRIPLTRWSYKTRLGVEHVGPMAQDFFAEFGLGEDDKHISGVDADGIALAAIQGLYSLISEKDAEIARLREANERTEERLRRLERLVADGSTRTTAD
jgi:hypothetical protein